MCVQMLQANCMSGQAACDGGPFLDVQWHGWLMAQHLDAHLHCFVVPTEDMLSRNGPWQHHKLVSRYATAEGKAAKVVCSFHVTGNMFRSYWRCILGVNFAQAINRTYQGILRS
jgi:hypothetical protein